MNKKTINDLNLKNKTVLLRLDLNVPLKGKIITSTKRITEAIPTIQKLIKSNAKIVIFSHLGRIKTEADKKTASLAPIAKKLETLLKHKVKFINQTRGPKLEKAVNALMPKEIILVENTRFEDVHNNVAVKYESKNNPELGKYWASLGEIFINDAFGTAHRAHASNVGIATYIKESAVGYLMEKEISMLSKAMDNPKKPVVSILGGAKVSDKIEVIKNLLKISDKLIIGGGMSYTFSSALGYKIGISLFEADKVALAKEMLKKYRNKIVLPIDYAISQKFENSKRNETIDQNIPDGWEGMDIGSKTIKLFSETLKGAKTVLWNGPMGVFEFSNYSNGTKEIASAITKQKGVFSIIGGGDSASAAIKFGFEKKFSHISTGGGASLEFMEGKKLPGIEAIQNKPKLKAKK